MVANQDYYSLYEKKTKIFMKILANIKRCFDLVIPQVKSEYYED